MTEVIASVGSNINRKRSIQAGLDALRQHFGDLRLSSVYETEAVGFHGEPFYNLVALFHSDEPPEAINALFKEIELAQGRNPSDPKFSPRTLDIDLILYGDEIIDRADLKLPRDEIERYAFVLEPLAEIVPQMRYPGHQQCFGEMWAQALAAGDMVPGQRVAWSPQIA